MGILAQQLGRRGTRISPHSRLGSPGCLRPFRAWVDRDGAFRLEPSRVGASQGNRMPAGLAGRASRVGPCIPKTWPAARGNRGLRKIDEARIVGTRAFAGE